MNNEKIWIAFVGCTLFLQVCVIEAGDQARRQRARRNKPIANEAVQVASNEYCSDIACYLLAAQCTKHENIGSINAKDVNKPFLPQHPAEQKSRPRKTVQVEALRELLEQQAHSRTCLTKQSQDTSDTVQQTSQRYGNAREKWPKRASTTIVRKPT